MASCARRAYNFTESAVNSAARLSTHSTATPGSPSTEIATGSWVTGLTPSAP